MNNDPQDDHPQQPQAVPLAATAATTGRRATDVLLGKGRAHADHPGNQNYRRMVREASDEYNAAQSYADTTRVSNELVARVHRQSGRFLEFDKANQRWFVVDHDKARRKASQDLRNYRRSIIKAGDAAAGTTGVAAGAAVVAEGAVAAAAAEGEGSQRHSSASSAPQNSISEDDLWLAADLPFPERQQPDERMDQDPLLSDEAILAALEEPNSDSGSGDNESEGKKQAPKEG